MKKISMIFAGLSVLCMAACDKAPETEMKPGDNEHMPVEELFANGCLKKDIAQSYADDMKCLDANNDGCVTRAEWDTVMDYWKTHTPEPEQSLCDMK